MLGTRLGDRRIDGTIDLFLDLVLPDLPDIQELHDALDDVVFPPGPFSSGERVGKRIARALVDGIKVNFKRGTMVYYLADADKIYKAILADLWDNSQRAHPPHLELDEPDVDTPYDALRELEEFRQHPSPYNQQWIFPTLDEAHMRHLRENQLRQAEGGGKKYEVYEYGGEQSFGRSKPPKRVRVHDYM